MEYAIDYKEIDDVDVIICALLHEDAGDVVRVVCNGTSYEIPESPLTSSNIWFWFYIFLYIFLMLMSGVFSGLVLGLVTIDLTILKVLKDAGPPKVRKYATRITPLVENRHLLLVTLLLANAICMEALPLCLDRVSDPLTAMFVSVTTVLFFGEVIPQAICARYGLAIGATLTPFVYFLMALMFIVAYPISKLLDFMLGRGHGTFYRRDELKALVSLHGFSTLNEPPGYTNSMEKEFLTRDEVLIIQGALDLKEKKVDTCMIRLEDVFMLSLDTSINNDTLNQIQKSGLSHIPVYDRCRNNVQGILIIKFMIRLNATDRLMVKHLVDTKAFRKPSFVSSDTSLLELLNHFQDGKGHFSFVTKADDLSNSSDNKSCHQWCEMKGKVGLESGPCGDDGLVIGIVTMTDVIQDLLQRDLFSDTDTLQSSINSALQVALAKLSIRRNASSSSLGQLYNYHHHSYNDEIVPSPTCTVSLMDNVIGQSTRK